jgi:hypothetical protein
LLYSIRELPRRAPAFIQEERRFRRCHIKFPSETPLANLHLTMAQQMGVPAESFADSTGKLRELSEV